MYRSDTCACVAWMLQHIFGCMAGEGVIDMDGINGSHKLPLFGEDPGLGYANVTCGSAKYVCEHGPPNNMWALQGKPLSDLGRYPYGEFDDKWSHSNGASGNAIKM